MYAVCLILNDTSKLEDVLKIFYESDCGATTLDSVGMGKIMLDSDIDIPIFGGMRRIIEGSKPYNKTIISVIKEERKMREVVNDVNDYLDYDNNPGVGVMFITPVIESYGLR